MVDYLNFTVVLPIKDTPEERQLFYFSIKGIIQTNPGEILLALDAPANEIWKEILRCIVVANDYPEERLKIIEVPKDPSWNFQLAHVCWEAYKAAKYDKIFATNNDSVIRPKTVAKGFDKVGTDGVAVYSFTLGLRLKTVSDLIRYIFYRYRVWMSDYVFAGNYWLYRPWFTDIVDLEGYKKIVNGVDTYLTQRINEVKKEYRVWTDKAIGVRCLTVQNEDYPWRQFQVGVWLGANQKMWASENAKREAERDALSLSQKIQKVKEHPDRLPGYVMWLLIKKPLKKFTNKPSRYVWLRSFIYQHPWMRKGYKWALENENHPVCDLARSMEQYDFYYAGASYIKDLGIVPLGGTGSEG